MMVPTPIAESSPMPSASSSSPYTQQQQRHRQFFTFSYLDVWRDFYTRRVRRRSRRTILLWLTTATIVGLQLVVMFKATAIHDTTASSATKTGYNSNGMNNPASVSSSSSLKAMMSSPALNSNVRHTSHEKAESLSLPVIHDQHVELSSRSNTQDVPPRLLLGIMGNSNNHMGKIYRNRHRKLFQLWNDSRLCTWTEYITSQNMSASTTIATSSTKDCRVVYTFVVGAYGPASVDQPTFRWTEPLTRPTMPNGTMPRYKDISNNTDVTILNIRENMNEGKTPTFFAWAWRQAEHYQIPYIAKCDSDALFRWKSLLQFVYKELPPATTSLLAGAWRHKAWWNKSNVHDNTFWEEEYYGGLHMYLAGQLYITSRDLIPGMIEQAKRDPATWNNNTPPTTTKTSPSGVAQYTNYWEGHEDHDFTAMIEVSNAHKPLIRWLNMPRHYRFWEHPVKGEYWWKRILQRETKKIKNKTKKALQWNIPNELLVISDEKTAISQRSLLVILGATTKEKRDNYRKLLLQQQYELSGKICTLEDTASNCKLYYVFAVAAKPKGPKEKIEGNVLAPKPNDESEADVVFLNIRPNIHEGMGQTVLYAIDSSSDSLRDKVDGMLLLCQYEFMVNMTQWRQLEQSIFGTTTLSSSRQHAIVLGDLRDKAQIPREFPHRNESYWYHEFENIHMYLGSECLVFSMPLVKGMVEQARRPVTVEDPTPARRWLEGNLGHDLTVLAYFVPQTIIHWIPIRKSQVFWSRITTW